MELIASYPSNNPVNQLTASQAKAELERSNSSYEKMIDVLCVEGHLTQHDIIYYGYTDAVAKALVRKKEHDAKHG